MKLAQIFITEIWSNAPDKDFSTDGGIEWNILFTAPYLFVQSSGSSAHQHKGAGVGVDTGITSLQFSFTGRVSVSCDAPWKRAPVPSVPPLLFSLPTKLIQDGYP